MASAALLIDWENLKLALLDGNYRFTPGELSRGLREAAAKLALSVDQNLRLDASIAFAPAMALDQQTSNALQGNGVTPFVTHGGGQAADLAIAIRAMQLYYSPARTEFFIIVSGDSDYLPLADELNKSPSRCHIWGVDKDHTPKSIRSHSLVSYVADLLGLTKDDPKKISPEQQQVFLFMCHRLLDQGIHLGSINYACQKLAGLGIWDQQRIEQMWKLLNDQHVIDNLPGLDENAQVRRVRRLSYEREQEVFRPLWVANLIVERSSRRGHLRRGELMSLLGQCGLPAASCGPFLEALVAAGYLTRSAEEYVATTVGAKYGLIGAALRVALAYYSVTCEGRQVSIGVSQLINRHWPRFYKPGGHLTEAEATQSAADAKAAISRSIAMRVAAWTQATTADGRQVRAITVFEDHPICVFMRRKVSALAREIAAMGATPSQSIQHNDLMRHMTSLAVSPWASADVDAWVSLLAAERVITLRSGDIWLNNNSLRKVIETWV